MLSLAQINQRNEAFWASMRPRFDALMADPAIRDTALATLQSEQLARVPVYHQKTLLKALLEAEEARSRFQTQFDEKHRVNRIEIEKQVKAELGRKGGQAKKSDSLQCLIVDLVRQQPRLSLRELEKHLNELQHGEVIDDIEGGVIFFHDELGHSKQAPFSGLKHRLTRARKTTKQP